MEQIYRIIDHDGNTKDVSKEEYDEYDRECKMIINNFKKRLLEEIERDYRFDEYTDSVIDFIKEFN